ncbi:hypothetical protein LDC_3112 [sediment metagenome]|uniref:Uncharacterized protein n=1 Tax=sediment metagenome TaxID=749907 RepID=D9PNH9_9ZZZZ
MRLLCGYAAQAAQDLAIDPVYMGDEREFVASIASAVRMRADSLAGMSSQIQKFKAADLD